METTLTCITLGLLALAGTVLFSANLEPDEIAGGVVALIDDDSRSGAIMQITNAEGVRYVE